MMRFDLSYVLNKTSENNRKNFVKNDDIILTEYVVIYRIYFCSYQVRGKIYFGPDIILSEEKGLFYSNSRKEKGFLRL